MDKHRANASAFPSHGTMGEVAHQGMTLREYFAAMAMQGILTDETASDDPECVAGAAVQYADALIAELEKHS